MKTYAVNNSSGHTFYVMAADGSAPDREKVKQACSDIGGKLVDPGARRLVVTDPRTRSFVHGPDLCALASHGVDRCDSNLQSLNTVTTVHKM